jgi:hypothetical protein
MDRNTRTHTTNAHAHARTTHTRRHTHTNNTHTHTRRHTHTPPHTHTPTHTHKRQHQDANTMHKKNLFQVDILTNKKLLTTKTPRNCTISTPNFECTQINVYNVEQTQSKMSYLPPVGLVNQTLFMLRTNKSKTFMHLTHKKHLSLDNFTN